MSRDSSARWLRFARSMIIAFVGLGAAQRNWAQSLAHPDLARAVDSIAAAAMRGGLVAGMTIGVAQRGETLVLRTYGFADVELGVPTPTRAIYQVGSITKQFTATAILQLQDKGKLSLDDDVSRYLPEAHS